MVGPTNDLILDPTDPITLVSSVSPGRGTLSKLLWGWGGLSLPT